jgi:hypothetical protein
MLEKPSQIKFELYHFILPPYLDKTKKMTPECTCGLVGDSRRSTSLHDGVIYDRLHPAKYGFEMG